MKAIIFWTVFTAFTAGFLVTCAIEAVSTVVKKRKHGKRITIKPNPNNYGWIIFFGILQGMNAGLAIYSLDGCRFTESVLNRIKIVCYLLIVCSCILAFFLRTRAYITEDGIISNMSFFPAKSVKYSVETVENTIKIKLYTKRKNYDNMYFTKDKEAVSMLEKLYDEFDGAAPSVKFKSGTVKYLLTLLCASLIFIGGIFAWYSITKPVVFVGDKIVKTDSEYVLFSTAGYENLLFSNNSKYYGELAEKADGMYDYVDHSENITSDDIAALQQMPNLKHLNVATNNIDDLTEIGKLTQLEGLAFGGGKMYLKPNDYSPIKNLINLKYFSGLGLYNCNDMTIFKDMDNLIYFELTAAEIQTGLDIICGKENLLDLNLYRCTAEDFSPIEKCVNLKRLSLSDSNVTDISFLKNLTELEYLDIDNTNPEEYNKIGCCTKLKYLYISNTNITDLSFLKNLKSLERLDMVGIDNAEDYSVLLEMPSLKHINMSPKDSIPNEIIEMLREKGIECDVRY